MFSTFSNGIYAPFATAPYGVAPFAASPYAFANVSAPPYGATSFANTLYGMPPQLHGWQHAVQLQAAQHLAQQLAAQQFVAQQIAAQQQYFAAQAAHQQLAQLAGPQSLPGLIGGGYGAPFIPGALATNFQPGMTVH